MKVLEPYSVCWACIGSTPKSQVVRRGSSKGFAGPRIGLQGAPIGLTSLQGVRQLLCMGMQGSRSEPRKLGSQPGRQPSGIRKSVGSGRIGNMVTPVGDRTFPSNQRLHIQAKYGEHRQPTVLDLLQLKLGQGSGVLT